MGSPLDRQTRRRRRRSLPLAALVTVGALVAATGPATAATAKPTKDPNFVDRGSALAISAPRSTSAPGYTVIVDKSPFRVTTVRGGRTVLAT
ncbi:MAG: hypothetical protein ACRDN9_05355, partial [Streptosporangiaceae bacterium]